MNHNYMGDRTEVTMIGLVAMSKEVSDLVFPNWTNESCDTMIFLHFELENSSTKMGSFILILKTRVMKIQNQKMMIFS